MKALLVLEDGFSLEGRSFTGEFDTAGEVVFNTDMSGYGAVLTDPACRGQIVCMTYPLVGNVGICPEDVESDTVHCSALLIRECCREPFHWRASKSLPAFLEAQGIPGMEGLDTRALARHIRMHGSMRGALSTCEHDPLVLQERARNLSSTDSFAPPMPDKAPYMYCEATPGAAQASADGKHAWSGEGIPLLLYDFGLRRSLLRALCANGFEVLVVPPSFPLEDAKKSGARAVCLSSGPGNPALLEDAIELARGLIASLPLMGIGLGHQLIAHALGGRTEKLSFGHHGCNYPVRDLSSGRVEISSQNHDFHVLMDSLDDLVAVTHVNLNDNSLEGLRHKSLPVMSMQYQPGPGDPADGDSFFARFRQLLSEEKD